MNYKSHGKVRIMAYIEKRKNNSFKITVSLGLDARGHQIKKSTTYHAQCNTPKAIEKEVNKFAIEFEEKVKNGNINVDNRITFDEYSENWLNTYAENNLAPSTVEHYRFFKRQFLSPIIGYMKLTKIHTPNCQTIIDNMQEQGKSTAYIKKVMYFVSSVFKYACKMQIIQKNPVENCVFPKEQKSDSLKYFTLEQTNDFIHALTMEYTVKCVGFTSHRKKTKHVIYTKPYTKHYTVPTQFQLYFILAIMSGLRVGEMVALTWNDIEMQDDAIIIHVNKATSRSTKTGQFVKAPKTKAGIRNVPIPNTCRPLLETWYIEEKRLSENLGSAWEGKRGREFDDAYIFIQDNGKQIHKDTPYQKMQKIIDLFNNHLEMKASENPNMRDFYLDKKLPHIPLHGLRHTSATLLLSENEDIETVSKRLGHSKASITLNVYGHALETKSIHASNTIGKLLEI